MCYCCVFFFFFLLITSGIFVRTFLFTLQLLRILYSNFCLTRLFFSFTAKLISQSYLPFIFPFFSLYLFSHDCYCESFKEIFQCGEGFLVMKIASLLLLFTWVVWWSYQANIIRVHYILLWPLVKWRYS